MLTEMETHFFECHFKFIVYLRKYTALTMRNNGQWSSKAIPNRSKYAGLTKSNIILLSGREQKKKLLAADSFVAKLHFFVMMMCRKT